MRAEPQQQTLMDLPVNSLFGMAACPASGTSAYIGAAFANGFDIITTKTQRSVRFPSNVFPNVLQLELKGHLTTETASKPIVGYLPELIDPTDFSIANSCGNNSEGPNVWTKDIQNALKLAQDGQVLIVSVVGTIMEGFGSEEYHEDFAKTAELAAEAGAKVIELNLSCPNVATEGVICYSPDTVADICRRVRSRVGREIKVLAKISYFTPQQEELLLNLVQQSSPYIDGITAINTMAARIVNKNGEQAFPGPGREKAGVSGSAIKWAGIDMVSRLNNIRDTLGIKLSIIGVGGVMKPSDYSAYIAVGADAVQSATGAMWNPELALQIKRHIHAPFVKPN